MVAEVEGQDDTYFGYYHDGQLDSYDLFNASLQWQSAAFNVTLWGRNLTDEDYAVRGFYFGNDPRDFYSERGFTQLGEPRRYGVSFSWWL